MIEEEFRRLELLPTNAERVEHRVEVGSPLGVVLGVSYPARTRMLIIEGRRTSLTTTDGLEETRGLSFRLVGRAGQRGRNAALEIEVTDSRYNEIFAILADDVAAAIRNAPDEPKAATALQSRLYHWRRFLERARPEGLSDTAHRGLYGELLFLREHLARGIGMAGAVRAWRGPSREIQDFIVDGVGFEVKTTIGRGNQDLTITSEHQLDDRGLRGLFLYHVSMDAREGVGESLPALVDDIRLRCGDDAQALATFEDLLVESGYLETHRALYERLGFVVRDELLYEVRAGFPRLVEAEMPAGVARVRYAISAEACAPFEVPLDGVAALRPGVNAG